MREWLKFQPFGHRPSWAFIVSQGSITRKPGGRIAGNGLPGLICLNEAGHDRGLGRPACVHATESHWLAQRIVLRFAVVRLLLGSPGALLE